MRKQIEAVHGQAQLREKRSRIGVGRTAFHPPLRAPKALGQRAMLIGVAQAAQRRRIFSAARRAFRTSLIAAAAEIAPVCAALNKPHSNARHCPGRSA